MMTNEEMRMYDYMVETEIATTDELNLARNIMFGSWTEVLETVLFIRTGYRTLEQMFEAEMEEDFDLEVGFDPYGGCYTFDC